MKQNCQISCNCTHAVKYLHATSSCCGVHMGCTYTLRPHWAQVQWESLCWPINTYVLLPTCSRGGPTCTVGCACIVSPSGCVGVHNHLWPVHQYSGSPCYCVMSGHYLFCHFMHTLQSISVFIYHTTPHHTISHHTTLHQKLVCPLNGTHVQYAGGQ